MLLVVDVHPYIPVSICLLHDSLTLHLAFLELAVVSLAVRECHNSASFNIVIFELSLVDLSTLSEVVLALPMELSVKEVTLVVASLVLELPFAGLLAVKEVAFVPHATIVVPGLNSVSVLYVLDPVSFIHGSFLVHQHSVPMRFAIGVATLIAVSVGMSHLTLAIVVPVLDHALVSTAILELDLTYTLDALPVCAPVPTVLDCLAVEHRLCEVIVPMKGLAF